MERFVVVDDEPDLFPVFKIKFRRELESGAIKIFFFTSGAEVLAFFDKNPDIDIKLVLLDYYLPGMNGIEVLKELKKRNPLLLVYLYSGMSDKVIEAQGVGAGADKFLNKPLDFKHIKNFFAA
jgi:CheY-like chemotaxis protein